VNKQTVAMLLSVLAGAAPLLLALDATLRGRTFVAVGLLICVAVVLAILWHAKRRTEGS
jgi:hypothetical protein